MDDTIKQEVEGVASYFGSNVTYASEKAVQYIYNLQDDVVAISETHLDQDKTLKFLKRMRKGNKWNVAAACGVRKAGKKGLSAGVAIATGNDNKTMLTGTDHECITGNSRNIRAVFKADTDIILMHVYGVVGLGIKGANFEMLLDIAAATDEGRRMVIAMGDYNIRAEELEASGILKALGLTLVKADNSSTTCASGKRVMH